MSKNGHLKCKDQFLGGFLIFFINTMSQVIDVALLWLVIRLLGQWGISAGLT